MSDKITRGSAAWRSLAAFEEACGGRAALAETLAFAKQPNARQETFIALLGDADRAGDSLAALCAQAGITGADVLMLLHGASHMQAFVRAQQEYHRALPAVAEDIARKATDHLARCACTFDPEQDFNGKGHPECKLCRGRGLFFKAADLDAAKLVLEGAGMLKGAPSVVVNTTVENKTLVAGDNLFDRFVKATDAVAMLGAPSPRALPEVIDAET